MFSAVVFILAIACQIIFSTASFRDLLTDVFSAERASVRVRLPMGHRG